MDTQEALLYARRCARRTFNRDSVSDVDEYASIGAMAVLAQLEKDAATGEGLLWVVCQRAMIDEWRRVHGRNKDTRPATVELEEHHATTEPYELAAERVRDAHALLEGLPERLTPRQREVLQLLADGGTTRTIAADLSLSMETIKTHTRAVYKKYGVRTVGGAVAMGIALGEVSPPRV